MKDPRIFGLMAEFGDVNSAITAARSTYSAGYRKLDAYSPFPVEELSEAIGFHKNGDGLHGYNIVKNEKGSIVFIKHTAFTPKE